MDGSDGVNGIDPPVFPLLPARVKHKPLPRPQNPGAPASPFNNIQGQKFRFPTQNPVASRSHRSAPVPGRSNVTRPTLIANPAAPPRPGASPIPVPILSILSKPRPQFLPNLVNSVKNREGVEGVGPKGSRHAVTKKKGRTLLRPFENKRSKLGHRFTASDKDRVYHPRLYACHQNWGHKPNLQTPYLKQLANTTSSHPAPSASYLQNLSPSMAGNIPWQPSHSDLPERARPGRSNVTSPTPHREPSRFSPTGCLSIGLSV